MSESSSQDKTERATPKREREAREKGQLARSRELTTAVLIAGGAAVLAGQGADMVREAAQLMRNAFDIQAADIATTADMPRALGDLLRAGLMVVAPILLLGFLGAIAGPLLLGGWNFSAQALMPQFSRLNPVTGLGRIFSGRALMDLALGLVKVGGLGGITAAVLYTQRAEFPRLAQMDVISSISTLGGIVMSLLIWLSLGLAIIAALDVPWQVFRHRKDM
ncbi:MAG: EscU/YscU/HrcU family type III secretion system export apparatus switch protein, partial [Panacagrimonas sp.]